MSNDLGYGAPSPPAVRARSRLATAGMITARPRSLPERSFS
ncbi:MAG: hypothetical protein ACRD5F_02390 [Candidatus Acidiferrales bacterium]